LSVQWYRLLHKLIANVMNEADFDVSEHLKIFLLINLPIIFLGGGDVDFFFVTGTVYISVRLLNNQLLHLINYCKNISLFKINVTALK